MFVHLILDIDGSEVISIQKVKQADILAALATTPTGNISYILNAYESDLYEELQQQEWEDLELLIIEADDMGILVAKFDNDVLE